MGRTLFLLATFALAPLAAPACSRSPSEPTVTAEPAAKPAVAASSTPAAVAPPHPPRPPHPTGAVSGAPATLALRWDDPPRWQRHMPSTPMRAVEYRVPRMGSDAEDGECFVITFGPGQGGSVDDNITRWVKQLEPTSSAVERSTRTVNGMTVTRVEVVGTYTPMAMPALPPGAPRPGWRLVGDIVEAPSGSWFFKMTGPDATAKAAGKELDALIDSIRPS